MGAGVQGIEAYEAGNKIGLTVTGGSYCPSSDEELLIAKSASGECPTVGLAGGYTQGGGHSALASKYGLAADQALEWEVITGTGDFVTASPSENPDLYWALSGGGGGTYGIVYSLTAKAHMDIPTSGANLTFSSVGLSRDVYWEAVTAWHTILPHIVDAGGMTVWYVTAEAFTLTPFTGPGIPATQALKLLQPFLDTLHRLNITYNVTGPTDFPTYLDEFKTFQLPMGVGTAQYGGRLIPRSVVENNNEGLVAAIRNITEDKTPNAFPLFCGVGVNVNKSVVRGTQAVDNAVLPAWRDTLIDSVLTT